MAGDFANDPFSVDPTTGRRTFAFNNHVSTDSWPKQTVFALGGGYTFSAAPQLPVQRTFKLSFSAMIWYRNDADTDYDATIDPVNNAKALNRFYGDHLAYKSFDYYHRVDGWLVCKFVADAPLEIGKGLIGGSGVTDAFEVLLLEQPL